MEISPKTSDDTKAKLIEAAGEVFSQRGFRSATVREICHRAGAPIGAINYHFRDKKGLYTAVLEYSHQASIRKYPPEFGLRPGASPEEKLRAFIYSFLLRHSDEGVPAWHMKLIAQEIYDPTGGLNQLAKNSLRPLYKYLVGILYELFQEGEGKAHEDEESQVIFFCAMSIIGQCFHYFTGKRIMATLDPKQFNPADIDRIADHITRFSLNGIREISGKIPR